MTETVAHHLRQAVADLVPGFGGLQPSHFARHIAFRLAHAWSGRQFATLNQVLDERDVARVKEFVQANALVLQLAGRDARRVRHAALALAEREGLPLAPGKISEKIATRLGRHLRSTATPLSDAQVDAYAREVLPPSNISLTAKEFVHAHSAAYAERWRSHGRAAWGEWPPSQLRLGADVRPQIAGAHRLPAELQGSDRPVYDRYRSYYKQSARTEVIRCEHPRCQPQAPTGDLAVRSIHQVCGGLGLDHNTHRWLLQGLSLGLADDPVASPGTWADYWVGDRELPQSASDQELVVRVTGHLHALLSSPRGHRLRQRYGDLARLGDLIQAAVLLKAYREICRWEREHDTPMGRCGAAAVCALAIGLLPETLHTVHAHLRQEHGGSGETAESAAATMVTATFTVRRYRTMDLLLTRLDIVRAQQSGDPGWRALYLAWAAEQGPEGLLTADEFDAQLRGGE